MATNSTTKQVKGQGKLRNGNPINVSAQFGQPNGNPRHNGAWKKEDTVRYKLEKMITMSGVELQSIVDAKDSPEFEKAVADIILSVRSDTDKDGNKIPANQRFKTIEGVINQVYGTPKQTVETKDLTPPKPLYDARKKK